ncbi:MAG: response regulator transcription factor [Nitrospirae bacterium]|nr:response regulator transcription factor [Nitrospirota bacterium]
MRILLADDHALVRAGFRALIQKIEGVEVIAEAADGHEALRLIRELLPDIAFVDISMPGINGLEVTARAVKECPGTRIIILSMHADDEYVLQALRSGALGYILKDAKISELEGAIQTVCKGKIYLCTTVADHFAQHYPERIETAWKKTGKDEKHFETLTPRQREILQLIAEGHTTKEIAAKLNLSIKTIETYRSQIMDRLNIRDLASLVRYAIRSGIVQPE